nr:hypothetical protein [Geotalea toluenoxydans]
MSHPALAPNISATVNRIKLKTNAMPAPLKIIGRAPGKMTLRISRKPPNPRALALSR